jgi:hypothetical protein
MSKKHPKAKQAGCRGKFLLAHGSQAWESRAILYSLMTSAGLAAP